MEIFNATNATKRLIAVSVAVVVGLSLISNLIGPGSNNKPDEADVNKKPEIVIERVEEPKSAKSPKVEKKPDVVVEVEVPFVPQVITKTMWEFKAKFIKGKHSEWVTFNLNQNPARFKSCKEIVKLITTPTEDPKERAGSRRPADSGWQMVKAECTEPHTQVTHNGWFRKTRWICGDKIKYDVKEIFAIMADDSIGIGKPRDYQGS